MQDAGKLRESAFACVIAILLHAALWHGLSRVDVIRFDDDDASPRLQLTWIARPSPRIIAAPEVTAPARPSTAQAGSESPPGSIRQADDLPREAGDRQHEAVGSPPPPTRSLSAVFLEQARGNAEQVAQAGRVPADPFADRSGGFEPPAPDTIRMKPRISPKDIVAAVGQYLFAPPGYEQDPCPQNERNIRKLADGSAPKAMQRELDYERENCRP